MDFLVPFFNFVLQFFDYINQSVAEFTEFLRNGIYGFVTSGISYLMIVATVGVIKFKIFMIGFAWDVAQSVIQQLNISSALNAAWGSLDSSLAAFVSLLNVPEAINVILSARVTRFVLNFMGL